MLVKNNESPSGDGNAVKIGVSIKVRVIVKNNESPLGDGNSNVNPSLSLISFIKLRIMNLVRGRKRF